MEHISKIVISQSSGKRVGYILDVALDFSNLSKTGYYVVDEESETEFFLKFEDVVLWGEKFVFIDDVSKLEFVTSKNESLLGKMVVGEQGEEYGVLKDFVFKKQKCLKIITNLCEILAKNVKFVGEDVIFVSFVGRKKSHKREFNFKEENTQKVKIQTGGILPERVNLSSSFYLGKISTSDIYGYNNEIIVLKNEKITKTILQKAKKHNKLNQLYFAIKSVK